METFPDPVPHNSVSLGLPRREILRAGALGLVTLGLMGVAPLAEALQTPPVPPSDRDRAVLDDDPRLSARNEREWRANLVQLGTLSLASAEMALEKATSQNARQFAAFEATEQRAVSQVLAELGSPPPALDPRSRAIVARHEATMGAEFDRVFVRAQLEVHRKLLALNRSLVTNTANAQQAWTKEARHLAMLIAATVTEHIAHCEVLVMELQA